ncbi:unnamed protein product [Amoebophrya sp. A120]|nr:unnamed protein product [Amoebophrya sp. A120]|eukprot:GSA120T00022829001.1
MVAAFDAGRGRRQFSLGGGAGGYRGEKSKSDATMLDHFRDQERQIESLIQSNQTMARKVSAYRVRANTAENEVSALQTLNAELLTRAMDMPRPKSRALSSRPGSRASSRVKGTMTATHSLRAHILELQDQARSQGVLPPVLEPNAFPERPRSRASHSRGGGGGLGSFVRPGNVVPRERYFLGDETQFRQVEDALWTLHARSRMVEEDRIGHLIRALENLEHEALSLRKQLKHSSSLGAEVVPFLSTPAGAPGTSAAENNSQHAGRVAKEAGPQDEDMGSPPLPFASTYVDDDDNETKDQAAPGSSLDAGDVVDGDTPATAAAARRKNSNPAISAGVEVEPAASLELEQKESMSMPVLEAAAHSAGPAPALVVTGANESGAAQQQEAAPDGGGGESIDAPPAGGGTNVTSCMDMEVTTGTPNSAVDVLS